MSGAGDRRMYLVLLAFGAVLTVAGIVLAASGVSLHDHAFSTRRSSLPDRCRRRRSAADRPRIGTARIAAHRTSARDTADAAARRLGLAKPARSLAVGAANRAPESRSRRKHNPASAVRCASPPMQGDKSDLSEMQPVELPERSPVAGTLETHRVVEEDGTRRCSSRCRWRRARRGRWRGRQAARIAGKGTVLRRQDRAAARRERAFAAHAERPKAPAFDALWPKTQRPARSAHRHPGKRLQRRCPQRHRRRRQHSSRAKPERDRSIGRDRGWTGQLFRSSSPASSTEWPIRSIPTARSKRSCRRARCASARSPNCAITSSRARKSPGSRRFHSGAFDSS